MSERRVIAVDLGASSGRVISFGFDGNALSMNEVNRFPNIPVTAGGTLYWDALRLWNEITIGVEAARNNASSIGVDTWGVDFALLDREGKLLGNPIHYRDRNSPHLMDQVFDVVPRRTLFERTGIQFMVINGLYSLADMALHKRPMLDYAEHFVTIADLFNYWLTGNIGCEFTHATTQQMFNPRANDWDWETLNALGAPAHIFPKIVQPGTRIGEYMGVPVVAPGTHDTASAVIAVPTTTEDYAYISSGTWSLMGLELNEAVINDDAYAANLTNEGGYGGKIRLLKNVAGMWLVQQSRETWSDQGDDYDFETLVRMATEAEPFRSLIDPDDLLFLQPGDMPSRIRQFCAQTGQPQPETPGQIMRTIYESLALKYRVTLDNLRGLTGRNVQVVHITGGGSRNAVLCQMAADACNRVVIAGPVEATAIGNAIVQLIALGEFRDVVQAREMLSRTVGTQRYEPTNADAWESAYQRYKTLLTT